jgi:NRAMP (natural resistance-associated macrophage protein)-like metal ion transporter
VRVTNPPRSSESSARKGVLGHLGPGLITGAADDDPSGIATYSQGGAQWGYGLLWTVVLTTPLMIAIQLVSARIGVVTGRGLAANMRARLPRWLMYSLVALLAVANTINIAADLAAMAQGVELLAGGPGHLYTVVFGLVCLLLQVAVPYERYVRVLKWLTLALLSYVAVLLAVHVPWERVAIEALVPHVLVDPAYLTTLVAVLGTTISPYLFFWQAGQEVEDQRAAADRAPLVHDASSAHAELRRIKLDTVVGMTFSNVIAFFIMLTAAVTLHAHGITDIETSAQAAAALRPIAGDYAFLLFALGIIGTGMLAVPVLAGSAAYAGAEALGRSSGTSYKMEAAREFYAILAVATLGGAALDFAPIDPIRLLYVSAVINGVIAVPIMATMAWLASRPAVMGRFVISGRLRRLTWLAVALMALAVAGMFIDILS